jgi:hypothetical protein
MGHAEVHGLECHPLLALQAQSPDQSLEGVPPRH